MADQLIKKMGQYGLGWGEQTSAAGPTALSGNLQPMKDINVRHLHICNLQTVK